MKILVADKLPTACLDELRELGSDVDYHPDLTAERISEHMTDVGILIVRSTRVTPEAIEKGKSLQMVVRAGAGTYFARLVAAEDSAVCQVMLIR